MRAQRLADLGLLDLELARVGQHLPRRAGVVGDGREALGAGLERRRAAAPRRSRACAWSAPRGRGRRARRRGRRRPSRRGGRRRCRRRPARRRAGRAPRPSAGGSRSAGRWCSRRPVWQGSAQAPLDRPAAPSCGCGGGARSRARAAAPARSRPARRRGGLARVEVLVAGDREGRTRARPRAARGRPAARDLGDGAPAPEQLVEVGQEVLGLPAARARRGRRPSPARRRASCRPRRTASSSDSCSALGASRAARAAERSRRRRDVVGRRVGLGRGGARAATGAWPWRDPSARHPAPPGRATSHSSSAFWAWRRFSAWSQIALAVAVEHGGGDLLAGVGGQAVQRDGAGRGAVEQRVVDPVGREVRAAAVGGVLVAHRHPHVGVDRVGAARPPRPGRRRARRRPRPRARSRRARRRRPRRRPARPSERQRARDVVAVADVGEPQPLEARRSASRSVSRSASAWHGWWPAVSMLKTGIERVRRRAPRAPRRARAHAHGGHVAREDARRVARPTRRAELHLAGAQDHRVAAELDDAGLEGQPRAGGRAARRRSATARPSSAREDARRGLQLERARSSSASSSAAVSSAPVSKWRGRSGEAYGRMRVLTWNLFHGRAVPDRPATALLGRVRGDAGRLGAGTSRCCRRCRRGGRPRSARPRGASARTRADLAQRAAAAAPRGRRAPPGPHQVQRRRRQRDPRPRRGAIAEHRRAPAAPAARAPRRPRRRAWQTAPGSATSTPQVHDEARAQADLAPRRGGGARGGPATRPLVLGGDLNVRRPGAARASRTPAATASTTSRRAARSPPGRGRAPRRAARLSDHAPVVVDLRKDHGRFRRRVRHGPPSRPSLLALLALRRRRLRRQQRQRGLVEQQRQLVDAEHELEQLERRRPPRPRRRAGAVTIKMKNIQFAPKTPDRQGRARRSSGSTRTPSTTTSRRTSGATFKSQRLRRRAAPTRSSPRRPGRSATSARSTRA